MNIFERLELRNATKPSWHDGLPALTQKCQNCGKTFRNHYRRKFCGMACSMEYYNRRYRLKQKRKTRELKQPPKQRRK